MINKFVYSLKTITEYKPEIIDDLNYFASGPKSITRTLYNAVLNGMGYTYNGIKKIANKSTNNNIEDDLNRINWPCVPKQSNNRIVLIVAELSLPQCKMYRVDLKKSIFEHLGYKVYVVAWQKSTTAISIMQFCDFVLFYRVPFIDSVKQLYKEAERLCLKKYYDVDDLIFNEDLYQEHLNTMTDMSKREEDINSLLEGSILYRKAIEAADVFITSTPAILNTYREMGYDKPAYVLPNGIPKELKNVSEEYTEKLKLNGSIVKIFYGAGSKTHDDDFKLVDIALYRILEEYPQTNLYLLGELEISEDYKKYSNQIHKIKRLKAENYYDEISKYDIALIPLTDDLFNRCKSNIKYIEASLLHMPSIASALPEFNNIIRNKENGIIAKTTEDWYQGLRLLIENPEIRHSIAEKSFENVYNHYSLSQQVEIVRQILQETLPERDSERTEKQRILFTNCYYGLTSFGGATVVVEGLAESIAKRYSEKYDVYVFTVHASDKFGTGTIRKYIFNNVIVYSCCASVDMLNDIDNEDVNKAFDLILREVQPNIVHHHAVQGFGYGISKICINNGVPYVITLHDAWINCPKLFMFDVNNRPCGKDGLSAAECYERCCFDPDYIIEKRRKLKDYLARANKIYVPSDSAKKVMEKYIPEFPLDVNKNGIFISKKCNNRDTDRIVKFLFVAGGEDGKGYSFMIETLQEIADWEWRLFLIVPNNEKQVDLKELENHIEVLGHQTRDEMQELYDNIDVLLFPTLQYESYGLTVREAIAHDCFVVASKCGGPSEAIVDGVNGKLFDTGDKETFKGILIDILKNKDKYINYKTTNFGDVRTYDEQADGLLKDYVEIIAPPVTCVGKS